MDSSPSCDRIVLRFHSIFLYMKETTSKRTNSLHSFLLKYLLYTTNIFSIFQANTSGLARKEDWGWPASAVPVQCSLRIFSGWKCLRFPLSPVYSQLNFILMASVPTMEMTCPSLFSRTLTLAWSDPLCLVLKTHDRRTLSIDLPTRITIPIFHRLRLNQFLRKRGNNVVLELVCTQSGRAEQLSAPTEYMVKNDVTFSIV